MFEEAESLLCSEQWPAAQQLLGLARLHLPCICDVKVLNDCTYYKLNNDKVIAWCICLLSSCECSGIEMQQRPWVFSLSW